ncbi:isoprenyl transferase [Natronoglycomyces albus]|uniref:Isoprenyl transferase n=1 Tax=Natronoglycomyces albus TaxID=2811108 RepID=A0A895XUG5_9ACTN|nr:isoprenyl transferase [Natronoglycomyces albus]QSB05880.1 isoprenyl transferase [Natronoglycomyces albus]
MGVQNMIYRVYERKLAKQIEGKPVPRHVGIMIDGNRRWARSMGYTDPNDGHRAGAKHLERFLTWCDEFGVSHVTVYMLSTENFSRPAEELNPLLKIIADLAADLSSAGLPWRIKTVGALDLLPEDLAASLKAAQERTEGRTGGASVNLAVGYGGHQEITDAVKSALTEYAAQGKSLDEACELLDSDTIGKHLYTTGQPDADLVIRTSGEQRLSGFLLWQSAYSEFYFCDTNWPDFRRVDFLRALRSFSNRNRRYGK